MGCKSVRKGTNRSEAPPCAREKPRADGKMDLQTCGEERESRKRPTLGVGKKPNGKYQFNCLDATARIC